MSDEALLDLVRAASAGTLEPVRALFELDRRGLLSRGREVHARARRRLPRVSLVLAAFRAGRMSNRLPKHLTDILWNREDITWERIPGGHVWIDSSDPNAIRAGEIEEEPRRTRGVPAFASAFNLLEQVQGDLEVHSLQRFFERTRGYSLPSLSSSNHGSGTLHRLDRETVPVQIGKPKPTNEERREERLKRARDKTLANVRRKPPRTL